MINCDIYCQKIHVVCILQYIRNQPINTDITYIHIIRRTAQRSTSGTSSKTCYCHI